MSELWFDGFDSYVGDINKRYEVSAGTVQPGSPRARYEYGGAHSIMNTGFGQGHFRTPILDFGAEGVFISFDVVFYADIVDTPAFGDSDFIRVEWYEDADYVSSSCVTIASTGKLELWEGVNAGRDSRSGSRKLISDQTLELDVYYHLKIKLGTEGMIYVNGEPAVLAPATGFVPKTQGRISLCWQSFGFFARSIDNLRVCTLDEPLELDTEYRSIYQLPAADSTPLEFEAELPHYLKVNEPIINDATYVEGELAEKEFYRLSVPAVYSSSIKAISVFMACYTQVAGTVPVHILRSRFRTESGASYVLGTVVVRNEPVAYEVTVQQASRVSPIFSYINPATGLAWTDTAMLSGRFGFEYEDGTHPIRVSHLQVNKLIPFGVAAFAIYDAR